MSSFIAMALAALAVGSANAESTLMMTKKGGYTGGEENPFEVVVAKPSASIMKYYSIMNSGSWNGLRGTMLFVVSSAGLSVLEIGEDLSPTMLGAYSGMMDFGTPTSVSYSENYDELAISVASEDPLTKGRVYVVSSVEDWVSCDFCEEYVNYLTAGYLPDMVTFTPNGEYILTANEGEPADYDLPENDPPGTVSIFERAEEWSHCEVDFEKFDKPYRTNKMKQFGVRVTGVEHTTFSMDMEPEYIAVSANSKRAFVTLQENNAVALVEVEKCRVKRIFPLGYKMWGDYELDTSDTDGAINLATYPMIRGMNMPDAIATFRVGDTRYFVTANEGDSREYEDINVEYVDEIRVADLAAEMNMTDSIYGDEVLGRLKVTTAFPFDGNMDELYAFGARSISIYTSRGKMVWDSGDFMEQFTADEANGWTALFNSQGSLDSFDERSDDKGVEPEGLAVAEIDDRIFVFVALERIGGFMCWDVSNPEAPVFQSYVNTYEEDRSPESVVVIPAEYSPSGKPLLVGAHEVSNTLAIFEITFEDV